MRSFTNHSVQRGWLRLGIRGKVAAILFATLAVTLTVNSLLALHSQEQDILTETDRRGRETSHFIAQYLAYSVVSYDYHTLELLLQDLTRGHDILYAVVENTRNNVMAVAGSPPPAGALARSFTAPIRLNGELLGKLTLSLSTEHAAEILATRQREQLFGQMLAILLVLAVGFVALSAIIIRPLTVITRTLRRNNTTHESQIERIPLESGDEFGELTRGFNELGQRLDEARLKLESRIQAADRELHDAYKRLEAQTETLRNMNRELEQQNITDPLTGLYNRRYFEMLMETEVERAIHNDETISILLVEIDDFQEILQKHGHSAGDEVIRGVSRIITDRIRDADVACRYSGTEFIILCRRATIANAIAIADDLQHAMTAEPLPARNPEKSLRLNIGVATIPGVHRIGTAAEFFQCAEKALQHSRQQHEGGVVHFSMLERNPRTAAH